ncbi:MAG TPA: orotidine-5'-phosphate decarboxylase [Thermoanaerobaculia bacterium]
MVPSDRLIVALDRSTRDDLLRLTRDLAGVAGVFKIGLQAFVANGPDLVREITREGHRVFLDLKLHDIPNTVARSVAEAARLGVAMLTVHASGGPAMLRAAADAAAGSDLLVLGVTVLTALDAAALGSIGVSGTPEEAVVRLARLARESGLGGVVASPREIGPIRAACGTGLKIVTPGIRAGGGADDQARTLSAREAIAAGADWIVVGRPITDAESPRAAAEAIVREIS